MGWSLNKKKNTKYIEYFDTKSYKESKLTDPIDQILFFSHDETKRMESTAGSVHSHTKDLESRDQVWKRTLPY